MFRSTLWRKFQLLPLADFSLDKNTTVTTNGSGRARLDNLPKTNVSIRETLAPTGYVLSGDVLIYPIEWGQTTTVTVPNYRNPSLTIVKRDIDTQAVLAGAVFEVNYENGQTVQGSPFTTGADGTVTLPWTLFDGNPERTLIITEVVPPQGYHLSSPNWQRVTMRPGEDNIVTFENSRKPTITVQKRDAITGQPIANAEFIIEKLDEPGRGMLTGNPFRTDGNGQIVLPYQYSGRYRIVETRAANNYFFDPLEQNRSWIIEVRNNEDYLLNVENTLLPTLVITKMNHVTYRPVPLTHFRIEYEVPNSGQVIMLGSFVTDRNGQIIMPFVNSGWYRVTETRPAPGMSLNTNNSYRVFLAPGQNTYTMLDRLLPAQFTAAAETITPPEIEEVTEHLPPAVTPAEPPINPAHAEIEAMTGAEIVQLVSNGLVVTGGDTWQVGEDVWNYPLNSIVIKKTDATNGRLLEGATFELIHISTGESGTKGTVIGRFTTNHSGIIVLTGLEPGSYAVEEAVPPNNYMLSVNNRQTVFLRPDGHSVVEAEFSNYPYSSLLVVLRDVVTGAPLADGEFRVTNSGGAVVGNANGLFRTNQQGEIFLPNLRPDSYIVTQTQTRAGYELGSIVQQSMRVNPTGQTYRLDFTNTPHSSLIIRKIDSYDGSPLAGARYVVNRQNGEVVGEFITDHQGLIEIQGLLGWFTVRELEVPAGFDFDPQTVRNVEISPHAPTITTFISPRQGSLTIEAVDEFGAPLAGARFTVERANGERIGEYTTDAAGSIIVPGLSPDWYVVKETRAPDGYLLDEAPRIVEVRTNAPTVITFTNKPLMALQIIKVDADTGEPLGGARFAVEKQNGERVGEWTTDNTGFINIPTLDPDWYVIRETRAPDGYLLDETPRTVQVRTNAPTVETFVNRRLTALQIIKIDEHTGAPLAGARFSVEKQNGERVGEFTTDNAGIISIPTLDPD
ncbi:MAG: SpaA isopeptide-forming pilin-related protein, partial [Clostridiales bacterium]|nr:SpaA isopeptide-forming pilin-related protein [Clostridiales bacterium]